MCTIIFLVFGIFLKYHYNPCHFYVLLQFLEKSLKNLLVLIAQFDLQALFLGTGNKTQK